MSFSFKDRGIQTTGRQRCHQVWIPQQTNGSRARPVRVSSSLLGATADGVGADGPVLTQTELYLLGTELEINPILANKHRTFHLVFNLVTGPSSYVTHPSCKM